jgi:tetratricopeptide (TPR) repeat protein
MKKGRADVMIRMLLTCLIMLAVCAGCGEKGARLPPSALSHQEQAYIDQGNARADQGDLAGAIADYTQAITLNPQNAMAYNDRGNARADQGDLAGAIADYTQAITVDPQYASAYYNRGGVRATAGEKAGALADFRTAADLYQQQGQTADYQDALHRINEVQ